MVRILILITVFSVLTSTALFAEDDPVLAKAGDYSVRKSDFEKLTGYYSPDKQKFLQENPQQKVAIIKQLLEATVVSDIARKAGFDKRADISEKLQYVVNDFLYREYLTQVIMKDVVVTEEEQKQYYSLYKNKFSTPEKIKARHILFRLTPNMSEEEKEKVKEKAGTVLQKIKDGADFAELAGSNSEDVATAKKGGDLGYFERGKMMKPFEEAAFALKKGQMSDLVKSDVGYHIIRVDDYKEASTKTYDEVKDPIKEQLQKELARSKALEYINKEMKEAGMEIYADRITGQPSAAGQ